MPRLARYEYRTWVVSAHELFNSRWATPEMRMQCEGEWQVLGTKLEWAYYCGVQPWQMRKSGDVLFALVGGSDSVPYVHEFVWYEGERRNLLELVREMRWTKTQAEKVLNLPHNTVRMVAAQLGQECPSLSAKHRNRGAFAEPVTVRYALSRWMYVDRIGAMPVPADVVDRFINSSNHAAEEK